MERTRRGLLAACTGAAVAGCVGESSGTTQTTRSVLAYVRVANYDDTSHTVGVLVEQGDEIVHWSNNDLPASDGPPVTRQLQGPWGQPGPYTIHTRLGETNGRETFDVDPGGADCYGVEARIDTDGTTSLWFQRSPTDCETATATDS